MASTPAPGPDHPGYSRDCGLEACRGGGRPAAAGLSGDEQPADPRPERHIHFSPDPRGNEG